MKKTFFYVFLLLIFSSCSKTLLITQGEHGYAGELGDNYEIVKLDPISTSGSSFFGFGAGKRSIDGKIVNFFGSDINYKQSNFLRVLTFLVYSAIVPTLISENKKKDDINYGPEFLDIIGGLAIGGILNNLTWNTTSANEAIRKGTLKLIEDNRTVDLFVYPKYNLKTNTSLFNSKSHFSIISKGVKLKK